MPSEIERGAPPTATPAAPWTIDGLTAAETAAPASAQETADLLRDAADRGRAVAPVGGGTMLALGNPPERVDLALSTAGLAGVIDYEPTDLVLSVGAGSRLADVQAVLAEHGQSLPVDPAGADDATIGGLIATALTGPRRTSVGSLRDLLIGISAAHPSGTVTHAGGMVVKNVSGYDLARVYHGALGTLGVIVSANFKVLPVARFEATLVAPFPTLDAALAASARVRAGRLPPTALEAAVLDQGAIVAVRLEGREHVVGALAAETAALLATDATRLTGSESQAWWRHYVAPQRLDRAGSDVIVRCAGRPRDTATLTEGVVAAMARLGIAMPYLAASPALGSVVARLRIDAGAADAFAEAQAVLLALADHATILAAPPAWKRGIDVWGKQPAGFDVMQALKAQFDPQRTLNPGRFAGFI
ncbi:MAG TPA: FAD-binding protein [Thermomicrobiales bacterium]|nr:FAD-binding protein [Thermomicrobiales bacterium]